MIIISAREIGLLYVKEGQTCQEVVKAYIKEKYGVTIVQDYMRYYNPFTKVFEIEDFDILEATRNENLPSQ